MSSIAGPCLCRCGVSQASVRTGLLPGTQLTRSRSEPIEVAQFRVSAITELAAAGGGEDGEATSVGNETKPGRPLKGKSAQLQRWARARKIRSGRTVDSRKGDTAPVAEAVKDVREAPVSVGVASYDSDEDEDEGQGKNKRDIYMVSDGTGWTADHAVQAALGQFENCFVDQMCSVDTHLFSQVPKLGFWSGILGWTSVHIAFRVFFFWEIRNGIDFADR